MRTRSDDGMELAHYVESDSVGDSVFGAAAESVLSSANDVQEQRSDSGCSSEIFTKKPAKEISPKKCEITSLTALNPLLLYDQPRREKVDIWLRSAHFI